VKSIKKYFMKHTLLPSFVAGGMWVWGGCWQQRRHEWRVEKPADAAASAISGHCQCSVKTESAGLYVASLFVYV
jgi:hypothetical protein